MEMGKGEEGIRRQKKAEEGWEMGEGIRGHKKAEEGD